MNKKTHTLIIGGSRGMGSEAVKFFSKNGHIVSVIGLHIPRRRRKNSGVRFWEADLTDPEKLLDTLKGIIRENGKLDNLLFFQRYRGEGNEWEKEIKTSLTATKNIIEILSEKFKLRGQKSIVIVSSVAGYLIAKEQPVGYHVAKAGLNQMVRYYAVALGHRGIRINSVAPGLILKNGSKSFYYGKLKKVLKIYEEITPLGRMGHPTDVIKVIGFLCSADSGFLTGQNIVVDGGLSLIWQGTLSRRIVVKGER